MPKAIRRPKQLYYALAGFIGFSCCLGQSCSPSTLPSPDPLQEQEQVLAYHPDLPSDQTGDNVLLPLLANAGSRQIAQPNAIVIIDGRASADPAGGPLTFAWNQIAGPAVDLLNPSEAVAQFIAPDVQERVILSFSLTVSDGSSKANDITEVEVVPIPPPASSLTISALVDGSDPLLVSFAADMLDGQVPPSTLSWSFGDGTSAEGNTVMHTFTAAGVYVINLCLISAVESPSNPTCAQTTLTLTDGVAARGGGGASGAGGGGSKQVLQPNPQALSQSILVTANLPRIIELSGTEKDGKPLGFIITEVPAHGTLNDAGSGQLIYAQDLPYPIYGGWNAILYTPALNFEGSDGFSFVVNNGLISSPSARVTTTVASNAEPAYRTKVPPITPSRWLNPVAVPSIHSVNRDSYMTFIRKYYDKESIPAHNIMGRGDVHGQHLYAKREAFFYRVEQNDAYARNAINFLRGCYAYYSTGPGMNVTIEEETITVACQAYLWIKDCPTLDSNDHSVARNLLLLLDQKIVPQAGCVLELGAKSKGMGLATGRITVATLFPDDPKDAERRTYTNQVWADWWNGRDITENTSSYNAIWLNYLAYWMNVTQQEALYQDAEVKKLTERYLNQVTPVGIMPAYGDTVGLNTEPGQWVALFEKWATMYQDGRYKWAAHRIFDWTTTHESEMSQWGNLPVATMESLMYAYLAADESIPEQKPDLSSFTSSRKAITLETAKVQCETGYPYKLTNEVVSDKLVLRSGWDPGDLYALVETSPYLGHGHADTGSINYLTSHGSVLLADTPYLVKDHRFHNSFQLIRGNAPSYGGSYAYDLGRMRATVPILHDKKLATFAQVHIDTYMGQPASLDRRIFFVKNMFLWVQDTLNVQEQFNAKVGPAWQTIGVYPKKGANWANTCLTSLPVSTVWDLKYLMQWENVPWDLLVVFLPSAQAGMQIDDVTFDTTQSLAPKTLQNNMKSRVWYQTDTTLHPGTPVRFNSVLTPHVPIEDSSSLANSFQLVVDTPQATVVQIALSQTRTMWLGINETGGTVNTGPIQTDAQQFLVDIDGSGDVQFWVVQATNLTVNSQALHTSAAREIKEHLRP